MSPSPASSPSSPSALSAPSAAAASSPQQLERFEELLDRCDRLRAPGLDFDELRELSLLYRRFGARLARLRERGADPDAIRHLNALCVRAYAVLYSSSGRGATSRSRDLWQRLPRWLAGTARAQALAWGLMALGALLGGVLAHRDPAALYAFLDTAMGYAPERIDRLWASPEVRAEFFSRESVSMGANSLFGSQLFAHNTQVGLLAFASGVLAGVPSALLQLYNGMMLGAFTALFLRDPWPLEFAAWILPHAVPELTAITLCVSAGLVLGAAVALPGRRSRTRALREATGPALALFGVAVPLFALAAAVESFVRESALGTAPRLAVAAALVVVLLLAAWWVRELARRTPVDTHWLAGLGAPPHSGAV